MCSAVLSKSTTSATTSPCPMLHPIPVGTHFVPGWQLSLIHIYRTVKFNLYSDPECTQPIPAQYFQEIVTYANDAEALKTIEGDDLAKIDEGYYTVQYRFNLVEYIKQQEDGKTPYADENGEVRDGGITLYAKAWVEVTDNSETGAVSYTHLDVYKRQAWKRASGCLRRCGRR